jgi:hypothetical protein
MSSVLVAKYNRPTINIKFEGMIGQPLNVEAIFHVLMDILSYMTFISLPLPSIKFYSRLIIEKENSPWKGLGYRSPSTHLET